MSFRSIQAKNSCSPTHRRPIAIATFTVLAMASTSWSEPREKLMSAVPFVPLLSDRECWDRLPPAVEGAGQPLPSWVRAVAVQLPRTAAAMQRIVESDTALPAVDIKPAELDQAELLNLSPNELNRTLRAWLTEHRGNSRRLGLKHIEAVERLLTGRKSGRVAELPGSAQVVKRGGKLVFEKL